MLKRPMLGMSSLCRALCARSALSLPNFPRLPPRSDTRPFLLVRSALRSPSHVRSCCRSQSRWEPAAPDSLTYRAFLP